MRRHLVPAVVWLAAVSTAVAQSHEHKPQNAKPVTVSGEVLDLTCFMNHPASAVGMEHAACAKTCVSKGLPIGFLAEDGTVYLLISQEHDPILPMVADSMGKKVTVTGELVSHHGMKAIAMAGLAPSAAFYTCSMHPEVREKKPGSCPKCGMALTPSK